MQPKLIGQYNLKGGPVSVYDSGLDYPLTAVDLITPEEIALLQVPSTRLFYLGPDSTIIPFPALSVDIYGQKDLHAWKNGPGIEYTIYSNKKTPSFDPALDIWQIIEGKQPVAYDRNYVTEMLNTLLALSNQGEYDRFEFTPNRRTAELMAKYPINSKANFILASQLAKERDLEKIQAYLDSLGIKHFNAQDIILLDNNDLFFYLTRFYAPPPVGSIKAHLVTTKYANRAKNARSREILNRLPGNIDVYDRRPELFDAYFNAINENPDDENILKTIGATNKDRFYNDFYNYLKLYGRPEFLPPLTLNTINQMARLSLRNLSEFLKDYRDYEIMQLVGESINDAGTRREFIERAAEYILENKYFLILPTEAELCKNPETLSLMEFKELDYVFVGKGNFANKFNCYDITDVIATFEKNKNANGVITFKDPYNYKQTFSLSDLHGFKEAFERGRAGIPPATAVVKRLDEYISQMMLQQSSQYNNIMALRRWATDPNNKKILSDLWNSYFRMGMYMRQWKGPDNPYPLLETTTGREAAAESQLEATIQENVSNENRIFKKLVKKLPDDLQTIFWNLPIYSIPEGQWVENANTSIRKRYNEVIEEKNPSERYCIRMASAPWAYSAAYYLRQTLQEDIPGFPLTVKIDLIL